MRLGAASARRRGNRPSRRIEINQLMRPSTINRSIQFAENFEYSGILISPLQVESEIEQFLELLLCDPPHVVLEIGTARGGTLFLLSQVAHEKALLISIDLDSGPTSFGGRPAYRRRGRLYRSLGRSRQQVSYVAGDSHRDETISRVHHLLGGREVDLLFIDGDHSFAGVAADFEMYSPLVRRGGLVAFHDIVPGTPEDVGGVPEFWQQVHTDHAIEFVEDWRQGGYGIGVLRM